MIPTTSHIAYILELSTHQGGLSDLISILSRTSKFLPSTALSLVEKFLIINTISLRQYVTVGEGYHVTGCLTVTWKDACQLSVEVCHVPLSTTCFALIILSYFASYWILHQVCTFCVPLSAECLCVCVCVCVCACACACVCMCVCV